MQEPPGESVEAVDTIDEPDYGTYTLHELRDVRSHLDADRYPERAARLEAEIARRMAYPGKYEPAPPAPSRWWPLHWPRVLGILGVVVGLLGVLSHAGGMAAVFKATPAAPATAASSGAGENAGEEQSAEAAGDGAGGAPEQGTSEEPAEAGEPAAGQDAGDPGGGPSGDRAEAQADAQAASGDQAGGDAGSEAEGSGKETEEESSGEAGESEPGAASGDAGAASPGSMVWIMPTASVAVPREAPRWFLAWSAGTRFAGVLISLVVIYGAFLLARRREAGIFYFVAGLGMALALNLLEQGLRVAAGLGGAGLIALGLLLGILWNGTLIVLMRTGRREALR